MTLYWHWQGLLIRVCGQMQGGDGCDGANECWQLLVKCSSWQTVHEMGWGLAGGEWLSSTLGWSVCVHLGWRGGGSWTVWAKRWMYSTTCCEWPLWWLIRWWGWVSGDKNVHAYHYYMCLTSHQKCCLSWIASIFMCALCRVSHSRFFCIEIVHSTWFGTGVLVKDICIFVWMSLLAHVTIIRWFPTHNFGEEACCTKVCVGRCVSVCVCVFEKRWGTEVLSCTKACWEAK